MNPTIEITFASNDKISEEEYTEVNQKEDVELNNSSMENNVRLSIASDQNTQQIPTGRQTIIQNMRTWYKRLLPFRFEPLIKYIRIVCLISLFHAAVGISTVSKPALMPGFNQNHRAYDALFVVIDILIVVCNSISLLLLKSRDVKWAKCATLLIIVMIAFQILAKVFECDIYKKVEKILFGYDLEHFICYTE